MKTKKRIDSTKQEWVNVDGKWKVIEKTEPWHGDLSRPYSDDYYQLLAEKTRFGHQWQLLPTLHPNHPDRVAQRIKNMQAAQKLLEIKKQKQNSFLVSINKTNEQTAFEEWMNRIQTNNAPAKIKHPEYWIEKWNRLRRNPRRGQQPDFDIRAAIRRYM